MTYFQMLWIREMRNVNYEKRKYTFINSIYTNRLTLHYIHIWKTGYIVKIAIFSIKLSLLHRSTRNSSVHGQYTYVNTSWTHGFAHSRLHVALPVDSMVRADIFAYLVPKFINVSLLVSQLPVQHGYERLLQAWKLLLHNVFFVFFRHK